MNNLVGSGDNSGDDVELLGRVGDDKDNGRPDIESDNGSDEAS